MERTEITVALGDVGESTTEETWNRARLSDLPEDMRNEIVKAFNEAYERAIEPPKDKPDYTFTEEKFSKLCKAVKERGHGLNEKD